MYAAWLRLHHGTYQSGRAEISAYNHHLHCQTTYKTLLQMMRLRSRCKAVVDLEIPALMVEGRSLSFAHSKFLVPFSQPGFRDFSLTAQHSVLPGVGMIT